MAGVYPDVPGVRLPYDVDGTSVKIAPTISHANPAINGSWTVVAAGDLNAMNDGTYTNAAANVAPGAYSGRMYAFTFPQPVSIVGYKFAGYRESNFSFINVSGFYLSTDTTDGSDGTWGSNQAVNVDWSPTLVTMRSFNTVTWNNIKGIRIWITIDDNSSIRTWAIRDLALYSTWTSAGLMGWHPTLNQQIGGADLDVGDVPLGTVHTKTFRIKNQNALQANTVLIASTRGVASTVAGLEFSSDNTNWDTTLTLTSIAAGAISPVLYVRRTIGAGETANIPGIAQITFTAGSWT